MTSPAAGHPRRLLPLILAISGAGVLTFSLISPTLPDLAAELGVSRGVIGMVQGAVAIPGIFLAIFIGYIADLEGDDSSRSAASSPSASVARQGSSPGRSGLWSLLAPFRGSARPGS